MQNDRKIEYSIKWKAKVLEEDWRLKRERVKRREEYGQGAFLDDDNSAGEIPQELEGPLTLLSRRLKGQAAQEAVKFLRKLYGRRGSDEEPPLWVALDALAVRRAAAGESVQWSLSRRRDQPCRRCPLCGQRSVLGLKCDVCRTPSVLFGGCEERSPTEAWLLRAAANYQSGLPHTADEPYGGMTWTQLATALKNQVDFCSFASPIVQVAQWPPFPSLWPVGRNEFRPFGKCSTNCLLLRLHEAAERWQLETAEEAAQASAHAAAQGWTSLMACGYEQQSVREVLAARVISLAVRLGSHAAESPGSARHSSLSTHRLTDSHRGEVIEEENGHSEESSCSCPDWLSAVVETDGEVLGWPQLAAVARQRLVERLLGVWERCLRPSLLTRGAVHMPQTVVTLAESLEEAGFLDQAGCLSRVWGDHTGHSGYLAERYRRGEPLERVLAHGPLELAVLEGKRLFSTQLRRSKWWQECKSAVSGALLQPPSHLAMWLGQVNSPDMLVSQVTGSISGEWRVDHGPGSGWALHALLDASASTRKRDALLRAFWPIRWRPICPSMPSPEGMLARIVLDEESCECLTAAHRQALFLRSLARALALQRWRNPSHARESYLLLARCNSASSELERARAELAIRLESWNLEGLRDAIALAQWMRSRLRSAMGLEKIFHSLLSDILRIFPSNILFPLST